MGSDSGSAPSNWQAIIWTNDGQVDWRLSASRGFDQSIHTVTIANYRGVFYKQILAKLGSSWGIYK